MQKLLNLPVEMSLIKESTRNKSRIGTECEYKIYHENERNTGRLLKGGATKLVKNHHRE